MIYNLAVSQRTESVASTNPWGSRSPEWQTPSPLPEFNYTAPLEVIGEPYDYGLSGSSYTRMAPASSGD